MNKEELKEFVGNLFFESLDVLLILDLEKNKFILLNDNATELYGYSYEEFYKITPYELTAEFNNNLSMENKQEHIVTKGWDIFITKHKTKENKIFDVLVKSKKITFQGHLLLFITIIDISEESILKKYCLKNSTSTKRDFYFTKNYSWDNRANKLFKNSIAIELTKKETKLLGLLFNNLGQVILYSTINNFFEGTLSFNAIVSLIKRLRAKTDKDLIKTVKTQGYLIEKGIYKNVYK